MVNDLSPTLLKLKACPQRPTIYPKGSRKPISKELVTRFTDLIATSLKSIPQLLAEHPDLPPFKTLESWRFRYPWVATLWNQARKRQADFLIQHCLDLALTAEPKTAHVVRVKFDIYKFIAAKFHPDLYGDKSLHTPQQTTVNVGVSVAPERLNELRNKLDFTRTAFSKSSTSHEESRTHSESAHPKRIRNATPVTRTSSASGTSDASTI